MNLDTRFFPDLEKDRFDDEKHETITSRDQVIVANLLNVRMINEFMSY